MVDITRFILLYEQCDCVFCSLYAVDMKNTPDLCRPIASEFTLKENYDVFCGRLISSSALHRPSFVFMGPIFRQV